MIDNAIGGDLVGRCSKVLFVFIPGLCSYPETRGEEGGARRREGKREKKLFKDEAKGVRSTSRYGTIRRFGRKK